MKLVERPDYLAFLKRHQGQPVIKVVSGVRRAGKSTLFALFQAYLQESGVDARQIRVINFEDLANEPLEEYRALYQHVTERLQDGVMNYIFLDEVQHVPQFEKAVDSLFIRENVDLYLTGSNAYFMSGDLATLLSGRYVSLRMLPLSFREFCSAQEDGATQTLPALYDRYTRESALPYTVQLTGRPREIHEYLSGIYHTVLLKDIAARLAVKDIAMLERVTKFLFTNIGSLISIRKIANAVTSAGRKVDSKTIEKYVHGLEDAMLLYRANRFDVKRKELLQLNAKYYVVDVAFRALLTGQHEGDTGHILENVVYLELLRRGYEVCVGALLGGEIDFVTSRNGALAYYQVALTTLPPEVLARELKPLQKLRDQYPKTLLTLDEIERTADYGGIRKKNVLDWLLEDDTI